MGWGENNVVYDSFILLNIVQINIFEIMFFPNKLYTLKLFFLLS